MNHRNRIQILFVALAIQWCTMPSVCFADETVKKIALVIGVSDYFHKNIEDLSFAEKDARDLAIALRGMGFDVAEVVGKDANQETVQGKIDQFLQTASTLDSDSVVFIMFSGHGQQLRVSQEGTYEEVPFYCPRDAIPFDPAQHSLRGKTASEIEQEFKLVSLNRLISDIDAKSNSLQNLLVVDACRNNPAKGKAAGITGSGARELPRGISILFAARSGQKSWESADPEIQQGVMTHYLLKGLRGAAFNQRQEITWSRLVSFVQEEVEYAGWKLAGGRDRQQNPHSIINNDRTIILDDPRSIEMRRRNELSEIDPLSTGAALQSIAKMDVGPGDWPMWGGWPGRNNVPGGVNIPATWNIETGENIKWSVALGSLTYVPPVIANGRVFIGTNNGAGYLERFPAEVDLGVLLCLDEKTGEFQWQYSARKLLTGRVHDWPMQGIVSSPYADGDRLWFVDNRCGVVCLDANGFRDGVNDGPFQDEEVVADDEADVIWRFDMMSKLEVQPHNKATCSPVCVGDRLFVITGNGVDAGHELLPAPHAPSFICLDRNTGKLLWSHQGPGTNILHGQWASPAVLEGQGQTQVLFPGGDGWLYSFSVDGELLWKFDCNPKESVWTLTYGNRNNFIAFPVVYDGLVYIGVGQDPEHGEGEGHLWCIDPTKRGDISPTLAMKMEGGKRVPIAHKRIQAVDPKQGEFEVDNPNSGAVWHFSSVDDDRDGEIDFEEQYHRMLGAVVIHRGLLFSTDFSGLLHCFDAKTGVRLGQYDTFSQTWGAPLIVDGRVYQGDDEGEVAVFDIPKAASLRVPGRTVALEPDREIYMNNAIYAAPIVANNTLFITTRERLWAIQSAAP